MKRIIVKLLCIALCLISVFSCFACAPQNALPPAFNPTGEPEDSKVDGGIEDITISESTRIFTADSQTEYLIVHGGSAQMIEASNFLARQLYSATGAVFEIKSVSEVTYEETGKYIAIGCKEWFENAGLTMTTHDLKSTGAYIKNKGDDVYIQSQGIYGYQCGVLTFLKYVVGYEMYAGDTIVFTKKGDTLPDMEIAIRPDYELRTVSDTVTGEEEYGWGYQKNSEIYMKPAGGSTWHNTHEFLPPSEYKAKHPKWYSDGAGVQLCYTAHGDEVEYEALVNEVVEKLKVVVTDNPDVSNVTFTVMDDTRYCTCSHCLARFDHYGTEAGSIIIFGNKIASRLNDWLESQAPEGEKPREVIVFIFAYYKAEMAPTKLVNGEYKPIDDAVKMDEHLGVYMAPILYEYNKSIYHEENDASRENAKAWSVLTDNIHLWLYDTNFWHYMYPFDSWDVQISYYRFYSDIGVDNIKTMGQYYDMSNPTAFTALKRYIHAKAQFDVNVNYLELVNDFFANYYGEAGVPLKKMFDEIGGWMDYLDETYEEVSGYCYCDVNAKAEFWPRNMLMRWMGYIDEAYEAVEKYKDTDPTRYATLKKHILQESLFPRYALLDFYSGTFTANELAEMRRSFKEDTFNLNDKQVQEHVYFEATFESWGLQ